MPVKYDLRTNDNIHKFATGIGDDYITGCLPDYSYSKEYHKMIEIDLSKQQAYMLIQKQYNKLLLGGI